MSLRFKLGRTVAALILACVPAALLAQDRPVQRIATIVSVAVEEYGKGIDANGRTISEDEYQEALGFLDDAHGVAARLPGNATVPRSLLDSIVAAAKAKRPPADLAALNARFAASLGSEAALELPKN